MRRWIPLLILLVLAGCSGPAQPLYRSSLAEAPPLGAYDWDPYYVLGGEDGQAEARPELGPPEAHRFVEAHLAHQGADVSLAVDRAGALYAATFEWLQKSTDQGRTWTTIHNLTSLFAPTREDWTRSDGVQVHVDPVTDRLWLSHLNHDQTGPGYVEEYQTTSCSHLVWSDDGGTTWTPSPAAGHPTSCVTTSGLGMEQRVVTGPRPTQGLPLTPVYPRLVYICGTYTTLGGRCEASRDGGASFAPGAPMQWPPDPACALANLGIPGTAPDGALLVPYGEVEEPLNNYETQVRCPTRQTVTVAVSDDEARSWTLRRYAGPFVQAEPNPAIAVAGDGRAYLVARNQSTQATYLFRSADQFQTWEGPFQVSLPKLTLTSHPTLVVGSPGRVAIAYLGTETGQESGASPATSDLASEWHLFVAWTQDADAPSPTFITQRVTPGQDPVQAGCVATHAHTSSFAEAVASGGRSCTNLLNFLSAAHDPEGRVYVAFADGCVARNDCAGDLASGFQARERVPSVAIQDAGPSLLHDKPSLPALGLEHPRPLPKPS